MAKATFMELQAIASGIGRFHDGVYMKEYDATGCYHFYSGNILLVFMSLT